MRRKIWCVSAPRRSPPIAASSRCSRRKSPAQSAYRRNIVADAGAVGAGDVAARQARRPRHGIGLDADTGASRRRRRAARYARVGTENGREFFRVLIKAEKEDMDIALAQEDVVGAGRELVANHPDIGAIVLECTNMPPYAAALQAAVGIPV